MRQGRRPCQPEAGAEFRLGATVLLGGRPVVAVENIGEFVVRLGLFVEVVTTNRQGEGALVLGEGRRPAWRPR